MQMFGEVEKRSAFYFNGEPNKHLNFYINSSLSACLSPHNATEYLEYPGPCINIVTRLRLGLGGSGWMFTGYYYHH